MTQTNEIPQAMLNLGMAARQAAHVLANTSAEQKNLALYGMAAAIRQHQSAILDANAQDRDLAQQANMAPAFYRPLIIKR